MGKHKQLMILLRERQTSAAIRWNRAAVVGIMLALLPLPSRSVPEDVASVRAMSAKYAALQALTAATSEMGDGVLEEKTVSMKKRMLDDVSSHRKRPKSDELSKLWAKTAIEEDLTRMKPASLGKVSLQSFGISKQAFDREVGEKLGTQMSSETERVLKAGFDRVFTSARKMALEEQRGRLDAAGYPSQEDANRIDKEGWNSTFGRETLARLEKGVQRSVPVVFEENNAEVTHKVAMVKEAFDTQRKRQYDYVVGIPLADGTLSREAATYALEENVRSWIQSERSKAQGGRIYDLLPSAKVKLYDLAEQTEGDRFSKFLNAFAPIIDADSLRGRIRSDPASYRDRVKSQDRIARELLSNAGREAVQQYAGKPVPHTDMASFRERLKARLRDGLAETALWSALSGHLATLLETVRNELAREQFARAFRPVETKVWAVPETELKLFVDGKAGIATFEDCIARSNIWSDEPVARSQLLDETEQLVVANVGKLVEEGKRAWAGQFAIVKRNAELIHASMIQAAEKNQLGDKEVWIKKYTNDVRKEWVDTRVSVIWRSGEVAPANAATKYSPLFEEMLREIRKNVSEFYKDAENLARVSPTAEVAENQTVALPSTSSESRRQDLPISSDSSGTSGGQLGKNGPFAGKGGNPDHPQLGGTLQEVQEDRDDWLRWLLIFVLVVVVVLLVVELALWLWIRRQLKQQRAATETIQKVLGPFDVKFQGETLTFHCREKPEVWHLSRVA